MKKQTVRTYVCRFGRLLGGVLGLLLAISCTDITGSGKRTFDAGNLETLVDLYVRTNYFDDFSAFDRYQMSDVQGLQYTEAIAYQARDTVRWDQFIRRVERHRKDLEKEYAGSAQGKGENALPAARPDAAS